MVFEWETLRAWIVGATESIFSSESFSKAYAGRGAGCLRHITVTLAASGGISLTHNFSLSTRRSLHRLVVLPIS